MWPLMPANRAIPFGPALSSNSLLLVGQTTTG
jgi:hypothetical protein